jgi:hypothetical protein
LWHQDRLHDEFHELAEATTSLEKPSESRDVFFTISRARCNGFPIAGSELPPPLGPPLQRGYTPI